MRESARQRGRGSWRNQHVAIGESGENFDSAFAALAGLDDDLSAIGGLDVVDAGAAEDEAGRDDDTRRAPADTNQRAFATK